MLILSQFGGFLMVGGRLGDIFEHNLVLTIGMSLFNASTLLCALVENRIGLVVGRAFQGRLVVLRVVRGWFIWLVTDEMQVLLRV